jgi:hypothetical protein
MNAILVSHNGMGDNLFMIGALHFLLKFYNKIVFLCKNKYYSNVKLFFINTPNIICVPFDENNEFDEISKIISQKIDKNDIFLCGCHKNYLQSKITNPEFLNYSLVNKKYTINYDTINSPNYDFIDFFYKDIGLNLTICYDYFYLPDTEISTNLYNTVKNYYIIFIQLRCSTGEQLNICNLLDKYLHDENTILICNDVNLYDNVVIQNDSIKKKALICNIFVLKELINYIDVIKNADEIYIIDSCFIGIILPYLKTNKLKSKKTRIIRRDLAYKIVL